MPEKAIQAGNSIEETTSASGPSAAFAGLRAYTLSEYQWRRFVLRLQVRQFWGRFGYCLKFLKNQQQ